MNAFPLTSATLIQKIKTLPPGADEAAWVRFWDMYAGAIRQFAARKGGDENADDIVMTVFGKLVDVLRSGQYVPEKGAFHSYLSTMILNEVHMLRRKELVRGADRRVSLDAPISTGGDGDDDKGTLADIIPQPEAGGGIHSTPVSLDPQLSALKAQLTSLDEDWRHALIAEAKKHVFTKTAISERDRNVYREYVDEGKPIDEVASKYGLSRNSISQIKTRINRRIVAVGREIVSHFNEM